MSRLGYLEEGQAGENYENDVDDGQKEAKRAEQKAVVWRVAGEDRLVRVIDKWRAHESRCQGWCNHLPLHVIIFLILVNSYRTTC